MNHKLNILIIIIYGFYGFPQANSNLNDNCTASKIYLKTEIQEKFKRILFFKTNFRKFKTIDRILDHNSNIIKSYQILWK